MLSTLDLLRAERAAQAAEEARAPFDRVDSIRTFIASEKPNPSENITLEMCWLGAKEYERCWRAELLNRADEQDFQEIANTISTVDPARRSKCVFALTIWKNREPSLNAIDFRAGFCYRFEKVHSLKLVYGNPSGSLQIRQPLRADPLLTPGFELRDQEHSAQPRSHDGPAIPSRSPPQLPINSATETRASSTEGADNAAPHEPGALKRKKSHEDENKESGEVLKTPTKQARKSCSKELNFVSPTRKTSNA